MRITRLAILILWTLPLAVGAIPARAAGADPRAPLDLPRYTAEISRWLTAADRLGEHPEEASLLRKQLPDHWLVIVKQQSFVVPTQWLSAALDQLTASPKKATATSREIGDRLKSMLQDSLELAQLSEAGPTQSRAKIEEILRRREYRSVRATREEESFWDQISDWFWELLDKIFARAGSHPVATKVLLWGVVVALGLIFLVWLIYALANISFSSLTRGHVQVAEKSAEPVLGWQEWLRRARTAAALGEYRDAIRSVYGAAVRRFEAAGTWQVDPARTHREYVRLLPAGSLHRAPLLAITSCFERVWYGNAAASAADYEEALTELESLP